MVAGATGTTCSRRSDRFEVGRTSSGQDVHLPQDRGDDARPERRECPGDRRPARALAGVHDQDVYLGRRASNAGNRGALEAWNPGLPPASDTEEGDSK
jgi:hypothetical protein